MNASPVVAGVGPQFSSRAVGTTGPYPRYITTVAADNYGINVPTDSHTYYSWIFNAPDQASSISVTFNPETGWTGDASIQLFGGWTHNVDDTPGNDSANWVAVSDVVDFSAAGIATLIIGLANVYPAYVLQVVSTTGTGIVDWVCAGSGGGSGGDSFDSPDATIAIS